MDRDEKMNGEGCDELRCTLIDALRKTQLLRLGADLTPYADRLAQAIEARYTLVPKDGEHVVLRKVNLDDMPRPLPQIWAPTSFGREMVWQRKSIADMESLAVYVEVTSEKERQE